MAFVQLRKQNNTRGSKGGGQEGEEGGGMHQVIAGVAIDLQEATSSSPGIYTAMQYQVWLPVPMKQIEDANT